MGRSLTTQERAHRQRVMMSLRSWMEQNGVSRQEVADEMGITRGHLSTLINANRTPSQAQVDMALQMIDGVHALPAVEAPEPPKKAKKRRAKKRRAKKRSPKSSQKQPEFARKSNGLRPMNQFESEFVVSVANEWIRSNPTATIDQLCDVVRALSIGIRT